MDDGAVVDHYKVQRESMAAFHIAELNIRAVDNCRFATHSVSIGGHITRNTINAVLDGEGINCTLNGLYLGTDDQVIDNHTFIDHAKPHCNSYEIYKGILDKKAAGVFNGKIYVRPGAQKTDALQTNRALLLSDDATINTKPELEIYADDVKCTHGATIGQLDSDALFYLRSRGIDEATAKGILTYAFACEAVTDVRIDAIHEEVEAILMSRFRDE
jgi:Fe-S cluster assembly protein SufD